MTDEDDTGKPVLVLPNWTGWTGWTPKPYTGGRDTGNPTRLPLMERIKRKLLVDEPEMDYQEIAWLEFPHHTTARKQWRSTMALAQKFGLLAMHDRLESWPIGENRFRYITSWYIDRNAYKSWRATQSNAPAGSLIHLWLGAAPAPSAPAFPQGEPDKSESGAAAKHAALESLLAEIDKRAVEQGAGFDRHSLPGTKQEFHELLKAYHPPFGYMNTQNLADEYLKGKCQFQRGAKPKQGKGKAIWTLFPEHDPK